MLTLGIAGHVDHGKTSLVRALTGMETDRLPEEQRRGISIELGFAWLDVPEVGRVALIDMPGHEKFVRRMIAGAVGLDALLLVVAADEGVMPQGREHLAIARLLGLKHGAVLLTKTDLCDADMLEMAKEDVKTLTADTFLQGAPIWPLSVRIPETVETVKQQLNEFLQQLAKIRQVEVHAAQRPFRLAVDRSFTLKGRGTIVAGTAVAGQAEVEQMLEVLPQQTLFRVRSLERHGQNVQRVQAPGRVALNLAGATLEDVPLGSTLATPHSVAVSDRVDVELTLLPHAKPLTLRKRATIQLGTTQSEGAITLLAGPLQPGQTGLAQIKLDTPLPVSAGQGFVVRGSKADPRFGQTLGGGRVLHPTPARHPRQNQQVLESLQQLAETDAGAQIVGALTLALGRGLTDEELQRTCMAAPPELHKTLKMLAEQKKIRRLGNRSFLPRDLESAQTALVAALKGFHHKQPTRPGAEVLELHKLVAPWLEEPAFVAIVQLAQRQELVVQRGTALALPGFQPQAVADAAVVDRLLALLTAQGLATETPQQLGQLLEIDMKTVLLALQAAQAQGQVVRLTAEMWATAAVVQTAIDRVLTAFAQAPQFTTGELKEVLGLTRKHLIPFAEWLDAERLTVRDPAGNRRIRDKAREAWLQQQQQK